MTSQTENLTSFGVLLPGLVESCLNTTDSLSSFSSIVTSVEDACRLKLVLLLH